MFNIYRGNAILDCPNSLLYTWFEDGQQLCLTLNVEHWILNVVEVSRVSCQEKTTSELGLKVAVFLI